ncbi:hypothetical protein [Ornithinimicrobium flavum]|uniref:hypothetical protein n=1 Tax=Ornithinimicrobium flavum TaxID=1288636 RepID=UPI00106F83D0|nr:hypothetical protein [Ornithinimicrobium flavum]
MRRTMIGAAAGLLVLAGCSSGSAEPAQPPAQQDALTTATATAAPAPTPEDVEVTSEAPATSDEVEEPEADGDQSADGAESAVRHYITTLSAVHEENAPLDTLRQLAQPDCGTCSAFVEAAEKQRFGHAYMRYVDSEATLTGAQAIVPTTVEQVSDGATLELVFTTNWEGERWLISKIQVSGK